MANDLNDSLDGLFGITNSPKPAKLPPAHFVPAVERFTEGCPKCRGTGMWRPGYPCFTCKGKGSHTYSTSPQARAQARQRHQAKSTARAEERGQAIAAFVDTHKAEVEWLGAAAKRNEQRGGTFGFPQAMLDAVAKFGSLTENQLAAVRKLMARDTERKVEAQARRDSAPTIDVTKIDAAFDRARSDAQAAGAEGVRWLKLRLDTFQFLDMPARGQWKAAIRVTEGDAKLGRIEAGKFTRSATCTDEQLARILAAAADPLAAAKAYGLRFSSCSCCGRELTDPDSIALGIGPICAEKWFCA